PAARDNLDSRVLVGRDAGDAGVVGRGDGREPEPLPRRSARGPATAYRYTVLRSQRNNSLGFRLSASQESVSDTGHSGETGSNDATIAVDETREALANVNKEATARPRTGGSQVQQELAVADSEILATRTEHDVTSEA